MVMPEIATLIGAESGCLGCLINALKSPDDGLVRSCPNNADVVFTFTLTRVGYQLGSGGDVHPSSHIHSCEGPGMLPRPMGCWGAGAAGHARRGPGSGCRGQKGWETCFVQPGQKWAAELGALGLVWAAADANAVSSSMMTRDKDMRPCKLVSFCAQVC